MIRHKYLQKILMCGTSLLILASMSSGISNNVSAHRIHHHPRISKVAKRNNQYNHIIKYLKWVKHYNRTHKHNWSSYKINHLSKYLYGLSKNQKRYVNKLNKNLSKYNHRHNHRKHKKTIPWYDNYKYDGHYWYEDSDDDGTPNDDDTGEHGSVQQLRKKHAQIRIRAFNKLIKLLSRNDVQGGFEPNYIDKKINHILSHDEYFGEDQLDKLNPYINGEDLVKKFNKYCYYYYNI